MAVTKTVSKLLVIALLAVGCHRDLSDVPACVHDRSKCDSGQAQEDGDSSDVEATASDGDLADTFPVSDAGDASALATPPSCAGGLTCNGVSCCASSPVPAGSFMMGRAATGPDDEACKAWASVPSPSCESDELPEHSATVSNFRLDVYEVTVARFRKFVAGYPANKPVAGAGAHPAIAGSGWLTAWDSHLPLTKADLIASVKCEASLQTWTDGPASNENRPINCLTWYTAFAFCAWDGGRLPTEAEWEYAATGGSENRVLPWGNSAPTSSVALFGGVTIEPVGSKSLGAARWGQHDMSGNVDELCLDIYDSYGSSPVTDFAQLTPPSGYGVTRGGSWNSPAGRLRGVARTARNRADALALIGVRCARSP